LRASTSGKCAGPTCVLKIGITSSQRYRRRVGPWTTGNITSSHPPPGLQAHRGLSDDVATTEDASSLGLEGRQGALGFWLGLTVWRRSAKLVIFRSHLLTKCFRLGLGLRLELGLAWFQRLVG